MKTHMLHLRVGTHNVRGLTSHLDGLLDIWQTLNLHILLLQETNVNVHQSTIVERTLRTRGWHAFFSYGTGSHGKGTGILISSILIHQQQLLVNNNCIMRTRDGRGISLGITWMGLPMVLTSFYFPASSPIERASFMDLQVVPHLCATCTPTWGGSRVFRIVGGDFNFVDDPIMDQTAAGRPEAAVDKWREITGVGKKHHLVDLFRHLHPRVKAFSRYDRPNESARRLDRIYVSSSLASKSSSCTIGAITGGSDHHPIIAQVTSNHPQQMGKGRRRLRLNFLGDDDLRKSFGKWITQTLEKAPTTGPALWNWWMRFKRRLRETTIHHNHRLRKQARVDLAAAQKKLNVIKEAEMRGIPADIANLQASQKEWSKALKIMVGKQAFKERHHFLHDGERPSPAMTEQLSRPTSAYIIQSLQDPSGRKVTAGAKLAQLTCHTWSKISAEAKQTTRERRLRDRSVEEVLNSLNPATHFLADEAVVTGAIKIDMEEVLVAMKKGKSGLSPGLDGIPSELYRMYRDQFAPVLADLFTYLGSLDDLPTAFHEGLITVLHKKGDRQQPLNYRPISLLNTDYRLLAKVLANRFLGPMSRALPPSQTAFLLGRRIGENVQTFRALAELLMEKEETAYLLFCDFAKAYDTIDRSFLLQVMERTGVGWATLHWIKLLLSNTTSRALVNGFISNPEPFERGVRQGCPLAPLLYLFVAHSLFDLLEAKGHCLEMPGLTITSQQYADDIEIPVRSLDQIRGIKKTLDLFGKASGQLPNLTKCGIIQLGPVQDTPLPAAVEGIPVVSTAASLGFFFDRYGTSVRWAESRISVQKKMRRLAKLAVSAIGRGLAVSSYALSTFLYHAEYCALEDSPEGRQLLTDVHKWTAKLVDSKTPPEKSTRFVGIAAGQQCGTPSKGGFGVLPLNHHLDARHLYWVLQLYHHRERPWGKLAMTILTNRMPTISPLDIYSGDLDLGHVPYFLKKGFIALHKIKDVVTTRCPRSVGTWCCSVPLRNNPFLCMPTGERWDLDAGMAELLDELADLGVHSLGQLAGLLRHPQDLQQRDLVNALQRRLTPIRIRQGERWVHVDWMEQLRDTVQLVVPASWLRAVDEAHWQRHVDLDPIQAAQDAITVLMQNIGIFQGEKFCPLHLCSIKLLTEKLSCPHARQRRIVLWKRFFLAATGTDRLDPEWKSRIDKLFRSVWDLKWDNQYKEVLWRMVYNGLPTGQRMGNLNKPCPCGDERDHDIRHIFWDCPVAVHLRKEVMRSLPPEHQSIFNHNPSRLWLMWPIPKGVPREVWTVICLSMLVALDKGRKLLFALRETVPAVAQRIMVVNIRVSRHFWTLLHEVANYRLLRKSTTRQLSPTTSFFFVHERTKDAQIHVRHPVVHNMAVDPPAEG